MLPVLALVGRPNVGKSTLFNRITRSRDAIVADIPGLTRDRHYGRANWRGRALLVVDTGGFEPVVDTGIVAEMARQTRQAIAESDVVVFLVDARAGLAPQAPVPAPRPPRRLRPADPPPHRVPVPAPARAPARSTRRRHPAANSRPARAPR